MKKLIAILAMLLLLVGCGASQQANRLKIVEENWTYIIFVDTKTGVTYCHYMTYGGMFPLLGKDGQPISDLYDALTVAIEALERSEHGTTAD